MNPPRVVSSPYSNDIELLGLLRFVGVSGTAVDLQLFDHLPAELVLRQHAQNGALNHRFRLVGTDETGRFLAQAAWIERVVTVDLVRLLLARQDDLLGVDDDDVVAGIEERRIGRLALAGNDPGDLGRETAEDFAFSVDDEPFRLDVALFGEIRTHDSPEHTTKLEISIFGGPRRR